MKSLREEVKNMKDKGAEKEKTQPKVARVG